MFANVHTGRSRVDPERRGGKNVFTITWNHPQGFPVSNDLRILTLQLILIMHKKLSNYFYSEEVTKIITILVDIEIFAKSQRFITEIFSLINASRIFGTSYSLLRHCKLKTWFCCGGIVSAFFGNVVAI